MYGMWWLVIIFGAILLLSIITIIISCKKDMENLSLVGILGTIVFGIAFIVCVIVATVNPNIADTEYRKYEATRQVVAKAIEDGTDFENYGITQSIIKANEWYVEVTVSKEKYGNWSRYYNIDIDNIKPISLKNGILVEMPPIG